MARHSGTAWSSHVAVALLIMVGVVMLHAGGATAAKPLKYCKKNPRSSERFICPSLGTTKRESNCNPEAGPVSDVSVQATKVRGNKRLNLKCKTAQDGENGGLSFWYLVSQEEGIDCFVDGANLKFASEVKCKKCTYSITSNVTCPVDVCEFPEGVPFCG